MPEDKPYVSNVYNALKSKVQGFSLSENDFNSKMQDKGYQKNVYNALKQKVQGFTLSESDFYNKVTGPSTVVSPVSKKKEVTSPASKPAGNPAAKMQYDGVSSLKLSDVLAGKYDMSSLQSHAPSAKQSINPPSQKKPTQRIDPSNTHSGLLDRNKKFIADNSQDLYAVGQHSGVPKEHMDAIMKSASNGDTKALKEVHDYLNYKDAVLDKHEDKAVSDQTNVAHSPVALPNQKPTPFDEQSKEKIPTAFHQRTPTQQKVDAVKNTMDDIDVFDATKKHIDAVTKEGGDVDYRLLGQGIEKQMNERDPNEALALRSGNTAAVTKISDYKGFREEQLGLTTAASYYNDGYIKAHNDFIETGKPESEKQAEFFKTKLDAVNGKMNSIYQRHKYVAIDAISNVIGNQIAKDNKFVNLYVSKGDVSKAYDELVKQNPDLVNYKEQIAELEEHPASVPVQGGMGGLFDRGLRNVSKNITQLMGKMIGDTKENVAAQDMEFNLNPMSIGTSYSGQSEEKTVLDKGGKTFKKVKNTDANFLNRTINNLSGAAPEIGLFIASEGATGFMLKGAEELAQAYKITKEVGTGMEAVGRIANIGEETKLLSNSAKEGLKLVGAQYATSYVDNSKFVDENMTDDSFIGEGKRMLAKNALTWMQAGIFKAMGTSPTKLLMKTFNEEIGASITDALSKVQSGRVAKEEMETLLTAAVEKKMPEFIKRAKTVAGESIKMGAINDLNIVANNVVGQLLNSHKEGASVDEYKSSFVDGAVLGGFMGGMGEMFKGGKLPEGLKDPSKTHAQVYWDLGKFGDKYIGRLQKGAEGGLYTREEANNKIAVINTLKNITTRVDGLGYKDEKGNDMDLPLSQDHKEEYATLQLRKDTAKKILAENKSLIGHEEEGFKKVIEESDKRQEDILKSQNETYEEEGAKPVEEKPVGAGGEEYPSGIKDKPIFTDFNSTVADKDGKLLPFGEEIKQRVNDGEKVIIVTRSSDELGEVNKGKNRERILASLGLTEDTKQNLVIEENMSAENKAKMAKDAGGILVDNSNTVSDAAKEQGAEFKNANELNKGAEEPKGGEVNKTKFTPEQEKSAVDFVTGENHTKVQGILDRVNSGEKINENEILESATILNDLKNSFNNDSFANLIDPVIDKLLGYDNQTKTTTRTTTEEGAVSRFGTDDSRKTASKSIEPWEGNRATITGKDGKKVSGVLKLEDGKYHLYNENGEKVAVIGEKGITNAHIGLPAVEEVENPIVTKDGDIQSITLQLNKVNMQEGGVKADKLITIDFTGSKKDQDKALDFAIQLRAEQVGEFSQPEFEKIIKEVSEEVPVTKKKSDSLKDLTNEKEDNKLNLPNEQQSELEKQLPDTLSPAEKQGSIAGGEGNAGATILTAAVHRANEAAKERGEGLSQDKLKDKEVEYLKDFAKENDLWVEEPFGTPDANGMEQDVYFSEDGKIATKVNGGIVHDSWNDLFHRIAIHNSLFPDVAYTLKGFTEHDGNFSAVYEQPFIQKSDSPVKYSEVKDELAKMGFKPSETNEIKSDDLLPDVKKIDADAPISFINKKTGVKVNDLHGENVIKGTDGKLHFIDPIIELSKDRKDGKINPEDINSQQKQQSDGKVEEKSDPKKEDGPQKENVKGKENASNDVKPKDGVVGNEPAPSLPPSVDGMPNVSSKEIEDIGMSNSIINVKRIQEGIHELVSEGSRSFHNAWDDLMGRITGSERFKPREFVQSRYNLFKQGKKIAFTDDDEVAWYFDQVDLANEKKRLENSYKEAALNKVDNSELVGIQDSLTDINNKIQQGQELARHVGTIGARTLAFRRNLVNLNKQIISWSSQFRGEYGNYMPKSMYDGIKVNEDEFIKTNDALSKRYDEIYNKAFEDAYQKARAESKSKATANTGGAKKTKEFTNKLRQKAQEIKTSDYWDKLGLGKSMAGEGVEAMGAGSINVKELVSSGLVKLADGIDKGVELAELISKTVKELADSTGLKEKQLRDAVGVFLKDNGFSENQIAATSKRDELIAGIKAIKKSEDAKRIIPGMVKPIKNLVDSYIKNNPEAKPSDIIKMATDDLKEIFPAINEKEIRDTYSGLGVKEETKEQVQSNVAKFNGMMKEVNNFYEWSVPKREETPKEEIKRVAKLRKQFDKIKPYLDELGIQVEPPTGYTEDQKTRAYQSGKSISENLLSDTGKNNDRLSEFKKESGNSDNDERIDILSKEHAKMSSAIDDINKSDGSDEEKVRKIRQVIFNQVSNYRGQERNYHIENISKDKNGEEYAKNKKIITALGERIEDLNKTLKSFDEQADPFVTPEEKAISKLNNSLNNSVNKWQAKLEKREFNKKEEEKEIGLEKGTAPADLLYGRDKETVKLELKAKQLENNYYSLKRVAELSKQGVFKKIASVAAAAKRCFVLSRPATFIKLTAAATENIVFAIPETGAGYLNYGLSAAHLISPKLMNKAMRFGVPTLNGELDALKVFGQKETWKNFVKNIKGQTDDLSMLYHGGSDYDFIGNIPKEYLDGWMQIEHALEFPSRGHGAIKGLAKRAEYARSFVTRMENVKRVYGEANARDPLIQQLVGSLAYTDGKRSILMEDNLMTDQYRRWTKSLQKGGATSNIVALGLAELLPVVKVPTNMALMTARSVLGVPLSGGAIAFRSVVEMINGNSKLGISQLSPEHADALLRNLRRGEVGMALMMAGYFNPTMFGASPLRVKGTTSQSGLEDGEVMMFGLPIPRLLVDNPYFITMRIGATLGQLYQKYQHQNYGVISSAAIAASKTGWTYASNDLPLLATPINAVKASEALVTGKNTMNWWLYGQVKATIEPGAMQNIAEIQDYSDHWYDGVIGKGNRRKPRGLSETMEVGIPKTPLNPNYNRESVQLNSRKQW